MIKPGCVAAELYSSLFLLAGLRKISVIRLSVAAAPATAMETTSASALETTASTVETTTATAVETAATVVAASSVISRSRRSSRRDRIPSRTGCRRGTGL